MKIPRVRSGLILAVAWLNMLSAGSLPGLAGEARFRVVEDASNAPLPARIHIQTMQGQPVIPANQPGWHDHFACDGQAQVALTNGQYRFVLERGPEYAVERGHFTVSAGENTPVIESRLRRLAEMAREGWWSGETHLHRGPEQVPLLMQAEDLHVACANTWWNDGNPWAKHPLPTNPLVQFDGNRFYDWMCGEDERGGGALLFIGLKQPLPIAGSQREYPSSMKFLLMAKEQPGVWVDVEKPFWWDMPMWVASGKVDSIGIAHNHMHRDGVMDNEAWGKSRDRARYPGPQGNGYWTQDIYYHLLNAGIRLPPSAGSASGVLPNPVGYNRMYAHVEGELTWAKWWESVRRGRVFISNGPLLRVQANGEWPGSVFQLPKRGSLKIKLTGKLDSRDPIKAVEIIRNGKVVQTLPGGQLQSGVFAELTFKDPGWFLVRALADVPGTFRFASTGAFYVETPGQPARVSRASAQFFLDWVSERTAAIKIDDANQLEGVLNYQREAKKFWQKKVSDATCD